MPERPSPLPDALPDLPLFPLGTVVYPGALLPLRDNFGLLIALAPVGVFLLILILGLVYEWSKGALDWE